MGASNIAELPFASHSDVSWMTALFVSQAIMLRLLESQYGPLKWSHKLMTIHNRVYSIFSLLLCFGIISSYNSIPKSPHSLFCSQSRDAGEDWLLRYVFHLSKLYEYMDIFLVTLNGDSPSKIGIHFALHHLTVCPFSTCIRVVQTSSKPSVMSSYTSIPFSESDPHLKICRTDTLVHLLPRPHASDGLETICHPEYLPPFHHVRLLRNGCNRLQIVEAVVCNYSIYRYDAADCSWAR